ncbi:MAG: CotH kinase family protein [Verrucomicrobia bacterium]|nr:CotH kinase family protein [Verrucomicrobiota bacterium]
MTISLSHSLLNRWLGAWLLAGALVTARGATVVAEDDPWRFFKGLREASSPNQAAWRSPEFDDSAWEVGRGPFFYELGTGYFGNTELTDMNGRYTCVFLRRAFDVASPTAFTSLTLDIRSDDGCVVWLNGQEVARVNMPDGEPAYNGTSLPAAGDPNVVSFDVPNPPSLLRAGKNVLAIQAFNASLAGSSDFLIAATLTSPVDLSPPQMTEVFPPRDSVVRELTQIEVVFNEPVTGVDAADLLINHRAADSVEAFSPRNFGFRFPEPPTGKVQVAWSPAHGITDLAPSRNPFAGGAWSYTLDKSPRKANVVISEFLADNKQGIRDDFAERSDWIELLNLETTPVDLTGWFLTDDSAALTKWRFPAVTIPAGGYLLVWASGRDLTAPARPLHTNFRLGTEGEYLALLDAQTNVVSAFAPQYPAQLPDVSYGRVPGNPDVTGYFPTPTPGDRNGDSGPGFAPAPEFSVAGGYFTNAPVVLTLTAPSGVVRYTTNGTIPTENSPVATEPLQFNVSTVVHARVFQAGLLPGPVVVHAYLIAGNGVPSFSSNLPVLVIHTSGRGIPQDSRVPVHVTAFETFRGRMRFDRAPDLATKAQMEIRGQSSVGFPKKSYNLELNDPYGNDEEHPLLGLPKESDWVLYAPYTDKPLIHNFLAYELHREMGHWAPRCRFIELFIDTSGRLDYGADYQGVYILMEKIKVDKNRVDIARLTPYATTEPDITGGYMIKKDKDSPGDRGFSTSGSPSLGFSGQYLKYHEPKPREITPAQENWIRNYVNRFESALYAANWLTRTGTNHYSAFIDVDSFVDNHWIVEFAKQIDGYRLSNYLHKDRGGKLKMDPIWDWNLSFGNADYLDGAITSGWYYSLIDENAHIWLRRLIHGTPWAGGTSGDPDFNQRIADRWSELRTNIFAADRVLARIDELAALLDEAQVREFKRWPRLGQYVWPNPPIYSTPTTYTGVVAAMKNWIRGRYNWIESQFLTPPTFSRPGGGVSPGFPLTLAAAGGTIYYTTDGTDPRAPGGGIAPQARAYASAIALGDTSRVVARVRSGTRWSGPAAATFVVDLPSLEITELMFQPAAGGTADPYERGDYEFIELRNTGRTALDLRGFEFTEGVRFSFATGAVATLSAGARVLVVKNLAAFRQRYGDVRNVAGEFSGALANEGERLTLQGPRQEIVFSFRYDPAWHPAAAGWGLALVPVREGHGNRDLDLPTSWRAGSVPHGTPGAPEPPAPALPPVVVNEVVSHAEPPLRRAIELHNPNDAPADLSGWFLTDDPYVPKYRIPDGTILPPRGYRVFTETDFNPSPGVPPSFNLSPAGDEVFVVSADPAGKLTGYVHGFGFGPARAGVSFGRHLTSAGDEHFVAQAERTLGTDNAGPRVGPVVISEIMYHPPDVPANGALWDNTEDEYVELTNLASTNVALFDPRSPTNTWRLRDSVRYVFPTNTIFAPGERALVVSFDPVVRPDLSATFRTRYAIAPTVRLFGPFDGKLANDRDSVELVAREQIPPGSGSNTVSVLVDKVAYRDRAPWPAGADGLGFSLQRLNEAAYGNDPANWIAAAPTPGAPSGPGEAPVIVRSPSDLAVRPGEPASLSVVASGAVPLRYQWRLDDKTLLGATNSTFTIPRALPTNSGIYEVVVFTDTRAIVSAPARLTVGTPPEILRQPASLNAPAGGMAVLSVVAAGASPLEYQWRKDGQPIAGATLSTLTLNGLRLADAGTYEVLVTDRVGTSVSEPATLTVLAAPVITQSPLSQTVGAGETLTLSVAVRPDATLPLTYTWTWNGTVIASRARSNYVDLLSVPNLQPANTGQYQVRVANQAAPAGVASDVAEVQVVDWPDTDRDGMPDWFEERFGLQVNNAADASLDLDGDGASNLEEYRAGTEPNSPASVLRLEPPQLEEKVVIRFQGQKPTAPTRCWRRRARSAALGGRSWSSQRRPQRRSKPERWRHSTRTRPARPHASTAS